MIMILRSGLDLLGFYHLITHAVFKSLLFLCAGIVIHFIKNNQDFQGISRSITLTRDLQMHALLLLENLIGRSSPVRICRTYADGCYAFAM
jgi:NADH:ubiquinone oxidoreductase subunit 5 (subunit L)/multisubunit Na+/H+ antiporter MnhA subunit